MGSHEKWNIIDVQCDAMHSKHQNDDIVSMRDLSVSG